MKKVISIAIMAFAMVFAAKAGDDKPISVDQLPQAAQEFIKTHFADEKVAVAKKEIEIFEVDYKVIFTSGNKVKFNKAGEWEEVDCEYSEVPAAIIPAQITSYLKENFADKKVTQIERKNKPNKAYEVELDNSMEVEFNKDFIVVDIDY